LKSIRDSRSKSFNQSELEIPLQNTENSLHIKGNEEMTFSRQSQNFFIFDIFPPFFLVILGFLKLIHINSVQLSSLREAVL